MRACFDALAAALDRTVRAGETALLWFEAERSEFVRFNAARVRQAGTVHQASVRITLLDAGRQAHMTLGVSGQPDADRTALTAAVRRLRALLPALAADPFCHYHAGNDTSETLRGAELVPASDMAEVIAAAARGTDLVGFLASGPAWRGFASTHGQRDWFECAWFSFDWSLYRDGDLAVKDAHAGTRFLAETLAARVQASAERLAITDAPVRRLAPGRYDVYLAPAALAELFELLGWGGFGLRAHRTRVSPLARLADGAATLSPLLDITEATADGLEPPFDAAGFRRPPGVALVRAGHLAGTLNSARSAAEFDATANGAGDGESPCSLAVGAGHLPAARAAAELGTGLLVNNLWYTNYSDRSAGRVTGMTRFTPVWVAGGRPVAPAEVMRFDDSVYRMLGDGLEALSTERERIASTDTYERRSTASRQLPGALIRGFNLTL